VIAATWLRGGNAAFSRGGASFATVPVTAAGCTGILVVRADLAFYPAAFTRASRPAGPIRRSPAIQGRVTASIVEWVSAT
jgi:hypothetical protein